MTTLIDGNYTVLKSSQVIQSGQTLYRYRVCASNNETSYCLHVETKGFTSGEQFLYQGNDLDKVNLLFNKYTVTKE